MKKYIFSISSLKQGRIFPVHVLEVEENISEEYQNENFLITELENFNFQQLYYDETENKVKEKTKFQLYKENLYKLKIGEFFNKDTQEFMMIERPSKYHKWNGKTWEVDIEEVKEMKRQELKHIREIKISENLEVHGSLFQVREKDLENFEDVARAIRREKKQMKDTRAWILADNSIKTFTYAQLLDVLDERALRKERIFNIYGQLSMQLQQAKDIEQIENISWEVEE